MKLVALALALSLVALLAPSTDAMTAHRLNRLSRTVQTPESSSPVAPVRPVPSSSSPGNSGESTVPETQSERSAGEHSTNGIESSSPGNAVSEGSSEASMANVVAESSSGLKSEESSSSSEASNLSHQTSGGDPSKMVLRGPNSESNMPESSAGEHSLGGKLTVAPGTVRENNQQPSLVPEDPSYHGTVLKVCTGKKAKKITPVTDEKNPLDPLPPPPESCQDKIDGFPVPEPLEINDKKMGLAPTMSVSSTDLNSAQKAVDNADVSHEAFEVKHDKDCSGPICGGK
jgi:hypothetical protein